MPGKPVLALKNTRNNRDVEVAAAGLGAGMSMVLGTVIPNMNSISG
jgi:hypothetical protein